MYSLWCHHTVAIRAYDIKGAGPYHTSTLASIHNLKKSKTQISSIDKIVVQCNNIQQHSTQTSKTNNNIQNKLAVVAVAVATATLVAHCCCYCCCYYGYYGYYGYYCYCCCCYYG